MKIMIDPLQRQSNTLIHADTRRKAISREIIYQPTGSVPRFCCSSETEGGSERLIIAADIPRLAVLLCHVEQLQVSD